MTTSQNVTQLQQAIKADLVALRKNPTVTALETFSQKYLGRKSGELTVLLKSLKDLPDEARREIGKQANILRQEVEQALTEIQNSLADASSSATTDLTLPGITPVSGHLHPLTLVTEELTDIFSSMGFMIYEGPEMDNEFYNFEALNIPATHPARDIQDTFFVKTSITRTIVGTGYHPVPTSGSKWVMRTHTSNMQVRLMEQFTPPLRCIVPGRVFRNEATDASHDHTFYQLEGFIVDQNISIGQLIWTLREIFRQLYTTDVKIRLRPGYFPFVEPGYEVDMSCIFCQQKGCRVCKHTGWMEMGGSGMIHPNVFKAAGYPDGEYTGFAFGMGINRLTMLKYGIDDGRSFMENDLRFLEQF